LARVMTWRLLLAVLVSALSGCASLPPRDAIGVVPSHAAPADPSSPLGAIAHAAVGDTGRSGFKLLPLAATAFETRLELARQARQSLDMQTFVLGGDATGLRLLAAFRDAAKRGVHVRLLVDDLHSDGAQAWLSDLQAFANVEVRLINPFVRARTSSTAKLLTSLDDLHRVNHRMHNKAFIADNAIAVFGGRNMADEYFMRAVAGDNFVDLDVLTAGPIVGALSDSFDQYWNSAYAWPIDAVVAPRGDALQRRQRFDAQAQELPPLEPDLGVPQRLAQFATTPAELQAGHLELAMADARVLADPPDKLGSSKVADRSGTVRDDIGRAMGQAQSEVFVVSPYFVPGDIGMQVIQRNRARGVRLSLLTNSLAATDEPAVHAGYVAYRLPMVRAGVEIYELSPALTRQERRLGRFGATLGVLHAKVIAIDRKRLFVGSMNLDGRSERYNAEVGVLIDNEFLTQQFLDMMDFRSSAYLLRLSPAGELQWVASNGNAETVFDHEPEASVWRKLSSRILGALLPTDWL